MAVKAGIIGAGHMGHTHARILAQDKRVHLVGIADVAPDRADRLAGEVGAVAYPSLEALLDAGIDALYVTTPNSLHLKPVLTGLRAGLHVFSEKPMATSLAEARQILEAAQAAKGLYQIGFNYRFAPVHAFAKQLISEGKLHPYHVHIKDNRGELMDPPWVGNTEITGGYLYESTIHTLDLIQWLAGEIKSLKWAARSNRYKELDDFALLFEFEGGGLGTLDSCAHASWLFPAGCIEIYGDHATLLTEEMDRVKYTLGLKQEVLIKDYLQVPIETRWGYAEEDRLFIEAIVEGKSTSAVPAEQAFRIIELIDRLYRESGSGSG